MTKVAMKRRMGTGKLVSFAKIEKAIQEVVEMQKETDRRMKETDRRMKETDQQIKETGQQIKETSQRMKETDERWEKLEKVVEKNGEQLGGLGNDLGILAENMVGTEIAKRFNELDYHFDLVATKGCKITDKDGKTKTQVDVLLENGETVIAVEVKFKPAIKHIEHHIKQLKILKEYWVSIRKEHKKFMGAIAGATYDSTVKEAVQNAGLFVIEQSGDVMKIDMPEGWVPVEW